VISTSVGLFVRSFVGTDAELVAVRYDALVLVLTSQREPSPLYLENSQGDGSEKKRAY
jgi:hypothetical protein